MNHVIIVTASPSIRSDDRCIMKHSYQREVFHAGMLAGPVTLVCIYCCVVKYTCSGWGSLLISSLPRNNEGHPIC